MSTLEEWTEAVVAELDVGDAVTGGTRDLVLDLARDVAHGVARPAAPLTAYLLGLAAGRATDPAAAAPGLAAAVSRLAQTWPARPTAAPDPADPPAAATPAPADPAAAATPGAAGRATAGTSHAAGPEAGREAGDRDGAGG